MHLSSSQFTSFDSPGFLVFQARYTVLARSNPDSVSSILGRPAEADLGPVTRYQCHSFHRPHIDLTAEASFMGGAHQRTKKKRDTDYGLAKSSHGKRTSGYFMQHLKDSCEAHRTIQPDPPVALTVQLRKTRVEIHEGLPRAQSSLATQIRTE